MAEADDLVEVVLDEEDQGGAGKKDQKVDKKDDVEVVEPAKNGKDTTSSAPTAEEVAAKLKKDLEKANSRAAAAEQKARDEASARRASETEVSTTQLQLVANAIDTTKQAGVSLKEKYTAALQAQDFAAAADINEQIADNRARLLQLEQGKTAMEDEAKREKEQPRRAESNDPVERMASDMTPAAGDWVRAHPEYARDPRKTKQMFAAHYAVIAESDVAADSPEYFAAVEKKLGLDHSDDTPEVEVVTEAAKPTGGRRAAPPAAPVSNSGGASGGRPTRATLTKEQAEIAEMNGMTHREYWDSLQALKKEGRMN